MKLKPLLITLAFAIVITVVVIVAINNSGSEFTVNNPSVLGNSAGNLYNGGLFCEVDDVIYFSHPNDYGKLYSMDSDLKNIKKLSADMAQYICSDTQSVFYAKTNYLAGNDAGLVFDFGTSGICRYGIKKGSLAILTDTNCTALSMVGNYLFYTNTTPTKTSLYRMNVDGTNNKEYLTSDISPAGLSGQYLYYSDLTGTHSLYRTSVELANGILLYQGNLMMPVANGDYIYFINLNDKYSLCRIGINGGSLETIVDDRVLTYNFHPNGRTLYYQIDKGNNSRICSCDTELRKETVLSYGHYNSIHTTKRYIFFKNFERGDMYYNTFGTSAIQAFSPEVEKK